MTITLVWWTVPLVIWLIGVLGIWIKLSPELENDRYGLGAMVALLIQCLWTIPVLLFSLIYAVVFT